jgi:hypothetical protein
MSNSLGFGPSDSGRAPSTPSDPAGLYAAETAFLDHIIGQTTARVARLHDNGEAVETSGRDASPPGEEQLTAVYQAARTILESLRDHPHRAERSLEGLVGDWLREADRRLGQMGSNTSSGAPYGASFWQLEQERNIHAAILRHWWHWLHGDAVDE